MMAKVSSLISKSELSVRENDDVGKIKEFTENGDNSSEILSDDVILDSGTEDMSTCKNVNKKSAALWHHRLGFSVGSKFINLHLKEKILFRPV